MFSLRGLIFRAWQNVQNRSATCTGRSFTSVASALVAPTTCPLLLMPFTLEPVAAPLSGDLPAQCLLVRRGAHPPVPLPVCNVSQSTSVSARYWSRSSRYRRVCGAAS